MDSKLLIFGSKNFYNSINEVKEYLNLSLIFYDFSNKSNIIDSTISAIIVDASVLNKENSTIINKIKNKPSLLIETETSKKEYPFDYKILLPISFTDLKNKIINIITSFEFSINSSLKIKKYMLDKNVN